MVEEGWAVSYGRDYDHEETRARNRSAGLWAGEFTRPQDWRRQRAQGS
jgi:endonuclease YncB( thermonuclease family)